MLSGTIYGAILNDRAELARLSAALFAKPYGKPPIAPVLYVKPRNCIASPDAEVALGGLKEVEAAGTIGLLFRCDACRVSVDAALDCIAGLCLALDLAEPAESHYRPTVRQRARDNFLPLGAVVGFDRI